MNRTENALCHDLAAKLSATGNGAPDLAQKLQFIHDLLQMSPETADAVFVEILKSLERQARGLERAGGAWNVEKAIFQRELLIAGSRRKAVDLRVRRRCCEQEHARANNAQNTDRFHAVRR